MIIECEFTKTKKVRGRFINPHKDKSSRPLFYDLLKSVSSLPKQIENAPRLLNIKAPLVRSLGGSSFLFSREEIHVLTDPDLQEVSSLEKVDIVLLCHSGHFHKKTVDALFLKFPKIKWIVPKGVKALFPENLEVYELSWWQSLSFSDFSLKIHVTSVPSQHKSGKFLKGRNKTLWSGFVIDFDGKNGLHHNCYFTGETGYNPVDFKEIGAKWKGIDLCLQPPLKKIGSPYHMRSSEGVRAHDEVNAKRSVTNKCHLKSLYQALIIKNIDLSHFTLLKNGHAINW